ncbi:RNA-directed DNA polymerase, eukaryota [Tanacetum coccineum]
MVEARDYIQKAKVHWAIEGDENSKFYHGIINRKRSQLSIKGIMVDGVWVDDPSLVKDEFRSHFAKRFQAPGASRSRLNFQFPNRLNTEQAAKMEGSISHDEIRNAVWSCGDNKSPGPDGFTFEFFRKFWNVIGPDFCAAVDWFFLHSAFAKGCNSSFIALIPKTPDAKFVGEFRPISLIGSLYKVITKILANRLSNVISDLVADKQAMVFKVDFAKAYDSVRWDFLDDVLEAFGFGFKWRSWVLGSLSSGFGVSREMVNDAASSLGCAVMRAPFKYLGVMVGGNMSMVKTWDEVISKLKTRLSKWKCKALSIGGRLTLLKDWFSGVYSKTSFFVRGGIEAQQLAHLQNLVGTSILSNSDDRWVCNLKGVGLGPFQVKNIRCLLVNFLPNDPVATRWVKFIPIKINVFAWRVYLDRLPTRLNLNRRNIQVLDQSCPVCKATAESLIYFFLSMACGCSQTYMSMVEFWTWSPLSSYEEWLSWFKDIRLGSILKCMLEGFFSVSMVVLLETIGTVFLFAAQPIGKISPLVGHCYSFVSLVSRQM